jgi:hypothetical protein
MVPWLDKSFSFPQADATLPARARIQPPPVIAVIVIE